MMTYFFALRVFLSKPPPDSIVSRHSALAVWLKAPFQKIEFNIACVIGIA